MNKYIYMYDLKTRIIIILKAVSIILLIFALFTLPIWYYTILRFVIFILCIYFATMLSYIKEGPYFWGFIVIALIYNPFYTFYLSREMWMFIDVVSVVFVTFTIYKLDWIEGNKYSKEEKLQIKLLKKIFLNFYHKNDENHIFNELVNNNIQLNKITALYFIDDKLNRFENVDIYRKVVLNYAQHFDGLDMEIALMLNKKGEGVNLLSKLKYFVGLDYNLILLDGLNNGYYFSESDTFKKEFKSIKYASLGGEVALLLFKQRSYDIIIDNLDKFSSGFHEIIILRFIELYNVGSIKEYELENLLKSVDCLTETIAIQLINMGKSLLVVLLLDKFKEVDHSGLVSLLFSEGHEEYITKYLNKFKGVNKERIISRLINENKGYLLAENYADFKEIKYKELFSKIVQAKQRDSHSESDWWKNINESTVFDHRLAKGLIEQGEGWYVAMFLENFNIKNYQEIAILLIKNIYGKLLILFIDKFKDLDYQKLALLLIQEFEGDLLMKNIGKFKNLDYQELFYGLIKESSGDVIVENIENFKELGVPFMVSELLKADFVYEVASELGRLDHLSKEIFFVLLEKRGVNDKSNFFYKSKNVVEDIVCNLSAFDGLDENAFIKLIELDLDQDLLEILLANLNVFQNVNCNKIASVLIGKGLSNVVDEHPDIFNGGIK